MAELPDYRNAVQKVLDNQLDPLKGITEGFVTVPSLPLEPMHKSNPARWTFKRLSEYIRTFESELDSEHEIGARLVTFGQTVVFRIDDIGYYGPDIITFHGFTDNGDKVQLIQNIAQLSVLLIALKKSGETPNRIGFRLKDEGGDA